jgi:hypothetical protein
MLETNEVSNEVLEVPSPLAKHIYPISIRVFLMCIGLLCVITIPAFLYYELPLHQTLGARIKQANHAFCNKQYGKAIQLYTDLVTEYPGYRNGRCTLGKCYFAMIALQKTDEYDEMLYEQGWSAIPEGRWDFKDIDDVARYLPVAYQKRFKSSFRTVT